MVGQRLEHAQRRPHFLGVAPIVGAPVGPLGPVILSRGQGLVGIDGGRQRQVGRAMDQDERNALACRYGELGEGAQVAADQGDGGSKDGEFRSGDGAQGVAVLLPGDPGHRRPVVEAQCHIHLHVHRAGAPLHDADEGRVGCFRHHEVDERDTPGRGGEHRLQNQAVVAIGARDLDAVRFAGGQGGRDQPAAVIRRAKQGRKTGGAVEPGPA